MVFSFMDDGLGYRLEPNDALLLKEAYKDIVDFGKDKLLGPGLARKYVKGTTINNVVMTVFEHFINHQYPIEYPEYMNNIMQRFNDQHMYDLYMELTEKDRNTTRIIWI